MLIAYKLSMPNNNSWNGRWTGAGKCYARVENVRSEKAARKLLEKPYHYYSFGDGWGACVTVRKVDAKEARRLRKNSEGFCGYDWMIEEIKTFGRIRTLEERTIKQPDNPAEGRVGK